MISFIENLHIIFYFSSFANDLLYYFIHNKFVHYQKDRSKQKKVYIMTLKI